MDFGTQWYPKQVQSVWTGQTWHEHWKLRRILEYWSPFGNLESYDWQRIHGRCQPQIIWPRLDGGRTTRLHYIISIHFHRSFRNEEKEETALCQRRKKHLGAYYIHDLLDLSNIEVCSLSRFIGNSKWSQHYGCIGFSMYACGFSVPQMRQFRLFTYPPRSKWASSEKMFFFAKIGIFCKSIFRNMSQRFSSVYTTIFVRRIYLSNQTGTKCYHSRNKH